MSKIFNFTHLGLFAALLAGCGQAPGVAPISNLGSQPVATAQAMQTDSDSSAAKLAIEAQLALPVADGATVEVSDLQIMPTPLLGLYTFTALQTIDCGHGLKSTYKVQGTYSSRVGKVSITNSTCLSTDTYM